MRPHLGLCSVWLGYNRFPQCNLIKIDAWREHRSFAEVFVHWRRHTRHTWRMRNVLLSRVVSVQVECWMPLINCLLLCSVSTFFCFCVAFYEFVLVCVLYLFLISLASSVCPSNAIVRWLETQSAKRFLLFVSNVCMCSCLFSFSQR